MTVDYNIVHWVFADCMAANSGIAEGKVAVVAAEEKMGNFVVSLYSVEQEKTENKPAVEDAYCLDVLDYIEDV